MKADEKGFLIVDVLIAIMVLAVLFALFLGAMMQTAKVAVRSARTTDAISMFEPILFEIRSGLRPDLSVYGGDGLLKPDFRYKVTGVSEGEYTARIQSHVVSQNGSKLISLDSIVLPTGAQ